MLEAGYTRIERFTTHFPRTEQVKGEPLVRQQEVKDPSILKLCDKNGWLLITTDSDMRFTHLEQIKKCKKIAILATAHNAVDDIFEWVEGLANGRAAIERKFKKQPPPWFGQFNRAGDITTCYTVTEEHKTRRTRAKEAGEAA